MRTISIILFSLILNFNAVSNKKADNIQSDSLKLKISQMLIFGIGDLQKVLESDSMLDAYSKNYLGGIILFDNYAGRGSSGKYLHGDTVGIDNFLKKPFSLNKIIPLK